MADALDLITRMPTIASIRASVLMPLVLEIDKRSGKADLLLASNGILRGQLSDPYAVVPMARYVALFEGAASILGENHLGARLGTATTPADIGPMGVLFAISPTIKAGFQRISKYISALQGATETGLIREGDTYLWSYRLTDPAMWPRRQDAEYSMAALVELGRSSFHRGWKPLEVHFEHMAPRDRSILDRIFRCPLVFDQSANRIVMSVADAERAYRQEDPALSAVLERHIADLVGRSDQGETITDRVRALIGIYLGHKPITLPAIADEFRISVRTLQRRLAEEGTSLRDLMRETRKTIAAKQLEAHVQKSRIAEVLGYADSTVLWRARRGWKRREA